MSRRTCVALLLAIEFAVACGITRCVWDVAPAITRVARVHAPAVLMIARHLTGSSHRTVVVRLRG